MSAFDLNSRRSHDSRQRSGKRKSYCYFAHEAMLPPGCVIAKARRVATERVGRIRRRASKVGGSILRFREARLFLAHPAAKVDLATEGCARRFAMRKIA